ncbi:DUF4825 domain-containing protein [Paenibacillus lemnae]|uniref:DUF4825 domain-containing protein n=1 Tax=Paenibacillus lemnae TaxID=1330551 RepID=A0A848M5S0_PAELE|nr:DUF4825 domain-containing protein [Paenibacillus lemnae]NMO95571.1 DUF4825 domain-containing protein [Paenibacillus lemnae]
MKQKNKWILSLIIVGLIGLFVIEGYVKPNVKQEAAQYEIMQQDPATHHIAPAARYKSKYMGDAGKVSNLNRQLPYSDLRFTFQLYPDQLTAQLNFEQSAAEIEPSLLKKLLMYNTTANMVFIDNLEAVIWHFPDGDYTVKRNELAEWYGIQGSLSELQSEQEWDEIVQERVKQPGSADDFYKEMVMVESGQ